jgi:cystathionine beta-lyase
MSEDGPMPSFDPDAVDLATLRGRLSAKYQAYPADVLPAWVAEMDFPLAPPIAAALHAAIDRSDTGYPSGVGVADALVAFADASWGWRPDPSRVLVLPDVLTGLAQSLRSLTEPDDAVVLTPPVYPPFFSTVEQVSVRRVVEVPMAGDARHGYVLDLEGLAAAFARPDVTAFVLCSPHNPTGTVPTRAELETIAGLAARHGVVVVADEIHAPLVLPGATHTPYLSLAGDDAPAVSLVSASKAWNLPGLKSSQVVATAPALRLLRERVPQEAFYSAGHLGAIGAVAAYSAGADWLAEVVAAIDVNRRLLADLLAARLPEVGYVPPQATYLAWLDLRSVVDGDDPARTLLDRGRLAVSGGLPFGAGGAGHVRLNLATSPAVVAEIVDRMVTALDGATSR